MKDYIVSVLASLTTAILIGVFHVLKKKYEALDSSSKYYVFTTISVLTSFLFLAYQIVNLKFFSDLFWATVINGATILYTMVTLMNVFRSLIKQLKHADKAIEDISASMLLIRRADELIAEDLARTNSLTSDESA